MLKEECFAELGNSLLVRRNKTDTKLKTAVHVAAGLFSDLNWCVCVLTNFAEILRYRSVTPPSELPRFILQSGNGWAACRN